MEDTELVLNENTENETGFFASSLYEALSVVVTSIMIIAVIFTFVFRLVGVHGDSMINTLHDGDWILVMPYYSEPKYGDIVVSSKKTAAEGAIVKRVIAVSGDEVIVDEADNVYVNGQKLSEDSYTVPSSMRHGDISYPVTVPDGCVMLMGDNRPGSWDSRYKDIGFSEIDYLLGKAVVRLSADWNIYENFNK